MGMVMLTWLIGDPRGSATSIMVRLLQMCYAGGLVIKTLQWSSYKNLGPEWGGPRDFHSLWLSWLEIIMKMIPGHVFYCPNLRIYLPILSHMTKDLCRGACCSPAYLPEDLGRITDCHAYQLLHKLRDRLPHCLWHQCAPHCIGKWQHQQRWLTLQIFS